MKILIKENIAKNFVFQELKNLKLKPVNSTCIAETPCLKLIDRFGNEIFRIDVRNDAYFNGEKLWYLSDLFSIDIVDYKQMLKTYLTDVLNIKVNRII